MKNLILCSFLLLFFGFTYSQESVKIKEMGLEVMKEDIVKNVIWEDAAIACAKLGDRWRLPTIDEHKEMYKYKDKIGGFEEGNIYWSSTESDATGPFYFYFSYTYDTAFNDAFNDQEFPTNCNVRAVRDLK